MDFINKGVAWAMNICDTLEAMCLEVDDIMLKQHAEQANGSRDDMSPPTSDEVAGCKSFGQAGETNGSEDDMSPPTSEEVQGRNSFGKGEESCNLVNAIAHPSSALLSSCSDTCSKSIECEGKSDDKRSTSFAEPIKATIQASDCKKIMFEDFLKLFAESNERYPAFSKAAKRRYKKRSQARGTKSVIEVDKKLQAGDEVAGSNQLNDHDSWESDWVFV